MTTAAFVTGLILGAAVGIIGLASLFALGAATRSLGRRRHRAALPPVPPLPGGYLGAYRDAMHGTAATGHGPGDYR